MLRARTVPSARSSTTACFGSTSGMLIRMSASGWLNMHQRGSWHRVVRHPPADGTLCGGVGDVILAAIEGEGRAESAGLSEHDVDGAVFADVVRHCCPCRRQRLVGYLSSSLTLTRAGGASRRAGASWDLVNGLATFLAGKVRIPDCGNLPVNFRRRPVPLLALLVHPPWRAWERSPRRSSASASTSPQSRACPRAPRLSHRPHCAHTSRPPSPRRAARRALPHVSCMRLTFVLPAPVSRLRRSQLSR